MPLIIAEPAALKSKPDPKATGAVFVFMDTPVEELARKTVDGVEWVQVRATLDGGLATGWLPAAKTKKVDALPDKPTDLWLFVKSCTLAGRQTEGISRDYLIALAIVESDLQNFGPRVPGSTATGPFQITDLEWLRYLDNGGRTDGFNEGDRGDVYSQAYGAAFLTNEARQALGGTLGDNSGGGPYIPNSIDLFLVRMLGADAATKAVRASKDPATGAAKLSTLSPTAAAIANYARFLKPGGAADPTILEVAAEVEKAFDAALKRAFDLVTKETPEDLPAPIPGGTPPWLLKAREELVKQPPIKEQGTPPNPEIVKYFKATDLDTSEELAWCGAFVAWCLKNSGDASAAASVVKEAARAASWHGWGEELSLKSNAVPAGAVVVLSPSPNTDSSGHVAFFVKWKNAQKTHVTLLGGNQSDALNEKDFPASQIVWIGWRNWAGATPAAAAAAGPGGTVGPLNPADWGLYIQTLGEKESSNNYAQVNQLGYAGRWQFGALALIDLGYVRAGTKQSEMASDAAWTGKDGIRSRQDWQNNKAVQDRVMLEYTQSHYGILVKTNVLKDGAAKDHVAGLLAAAHLLGPGGAKKLVNGIVEQDANGTKADAYYALLSRAFGGDGVLDA